MVTAVAGVKVKEKEKEKPPPPKNVFGKTSDKDTYFSASARGGQ